MGLGLARHYLREGANVTVIGRDAEKGRRFLDEAGERGAFIQADLTVVAENKRVIEEVKARHESLDGLVNTAMRQFSRRVETVDGFEGTFSLYYVSRFVLGYGLTELLEKGSDPVIVNVGGVGVTKGRIHWDDLRLKQGYSGIKATLQAGRAADLLGVGYAANHVGGRTRYLLHHPGFTDSGTESLPQPAKALIRTLARFFAQPVEKSIQPIIELMDTPGPGGLLAYDRRDPVDPSLSTLDPAAARRLYELTEHVL